MLPIRQLFPKRLNLLLIGLLTAVALAPGLARGADVPGQGLTGADPAFDQYVNLDLLATAWADKNAPLLADLGLQLAEGERVLFRPHKLISADHVLATAVKIAIEKKDVATVTRLSKALDSLKKTDLAAQVESAQKLVADSRAPTPALAVPVEKMSPEVYLLFRDMLESITAAKVDGDGEALDIMIQLTPSLLQIPDVQRKHLVKIATDARAALPNEAEIDPAVAALNKLFDGSRGVTANGAEYGSLGVKCVPTNKGMRVIGFTQGGPIAFKDGSKLNKNDLILRVGDQPCSGAAVDLDDLVETAAAQKQTKLLVYDAASRKIKICELAATAAATK